MNFLFVHRDCPGQFGVLASTLSHSGNHRVVFISSGDGDAPDGFEQRTYRPRRQPARQTHHYLSGFESGVLNGQAVYEVCHGLKREGFSPDVIFAHCGWGVSLYLREVFPAARIIGYFEWFYHPHGSDADYLDPGAMTPDNACRIRTLNAPILMALEDSDMGITPTEFQRSQFPDSYRSRLLTLHDGVDTGYFRPDTGACRVVGGHDFSGVETLVTYATRGMEPYRGFPEFMRAVAELLRVDPALHVAIAGEDRAFYSRAAGNGGTYKERVLRELPGLDPGRLHFMGMLPRDEYRRLLQISSLHAYLTVPFVPSWSLVEAMACGCAIVASDMPGTREILAEGSAFAFVDHRDWQSLEKVMEAALSDPAGARRARENARKRADTAYSLGRLLPEWERIATDGGIRVARGPSTCV